MIKKKGLVSFILTFLLAFNLLFSTIASAKTDTTTLTSTPQIEQNSKDAQLINKIDTEITPYVVIMPTAYWGKLAEFIMGSVVDELISEIWSEVKNWISITPFKFGKEANQDSTVKILGDQFNHKDPANWCGDGRTNSYTRVRQLQTCLVNTGYNPGAIDGYWGSKTKAALKLFQADYGLTSDGVCGTNTWRKFAGAN